MDPHINGIDQASSLYCNFREKKALVTFSSVITLNHTLSGFCKNNFARLLENITATVYGNRL